MVEFLIRLFHAEFLAGIKFNNLATGFRRFLDGFHHGVIVKGPRLAAERETIRLQSSGIGVAEAKLPVSAPQITASRIKIFNFIMEQSVRLCIGILFHIVGISPLTYFGEARVIRMMGQVLNQPDLFGQQKSKFYRPLNRRPNKK
ncbi:MAG: hypothetical protein WDN00_17115 [Limisphaerales bacterium]